MIKYFEILKEVTKEELIEKFKSHELKREPADMYAQKTIIGGLENSNVLSYFKCRLKVEGLNNLILPYHAHNATTTGPQWGKEFQGVVADVISIPEWANSDCVKKILEIKENFFGTPGDFWYPEFLLLSNDKDLVHPGGDHYHANYGRDKLFIGNGFHRLVAYGLALRDIDKFIPLELYYGENKNLY